MFLSAGKRSIAESGVCEHCNPVRELDSGNLPVGSISCADALRGLLWRACKQFDGFSSNAAVNHLRSGAAKNFNSFSL
jgi:hypothetical protein